MAVLTNAEQAELILRLYRWRGVMSSKANIRAALQAIEDAVQSVANVGPRSLKAYIGNAIETAAPGVFSAAQKDDLFIAWSRLNAQRGGVI